MMRSDITLIGGEAASITLIRVLGEAASVTLIWEEAASITLKWGEAESINLIWEEAASSTLIWEEVARFTLTWGEAETITLISREFCTLSIITSHHRNQHSFKSNSRCANTTAPSVTADAGISPFPFPAYDKYVESGSQHFPSDCKSVFYSCLLEPSRV
jgi:hypothetical protein